MSQDAIVHIVDDDEAMRKSLSMLMRSIDIEPVSYKSADEFLRNYSETERSCILLDVRMPGMSGPDLQAKLPERNISTPVIMMTGHGDISTAVNAMKAGAMDFVEKPFDHEVLINTIRRCIDLSEVVHKQTGSHTYAQMLTQLTKREVDVFDLLVEGKINKVIADELNLSVRTVEAHRAHIMAKLGAKSLSDLVKISIYSKLPEAIV